jgi:hypothetical protein
MARRKQQVDAEILSDEVKDIIDFQKESAFDHHEMADWRDSWMAKKRDNIQAISMFMDRARRSSRIARTLLFALLNTPGGRGT